LGILISDTFTEHKDVENFERVCKVRFERKYFVRTYDEWKAKFIQLQSEVDMMILGSYAGVPDFDEQDARLFTVNNYRIPSGTYNRSFMPYAMIGVVRDPKELGQWAAQTVLRILDGASPSDIPLTRNKREKLVVNMTIANQLGVVFKMAVLKKAEIIR
jgi:hypothetical protein